jgi:DNA-binding LacI/PurR family transcriptional regulator/DeoR/GlpR family transcriptional regulator of sugar metabolism
VITKAVSQRARRDGYALFVADSDGPSTRLTVDDLRLAHAMAKQVDGLLLLSPTTVDDDLRALAATVPVVVINHDLEGVPTVLMPTADGAASAVEHLHALGHRRLAYLAGPDNYSNRIRTEAFTRTCGRLGLDGNVMGPFGPTFSGGVRAADLILADGATGVLAYNDDVAAGVVGRLTDRGVPVPARLSIVGFDDTALASMITPRLTTVRLPMADAGEVAVGLLVDALRGAPARGPVELPAELIVRRSTGPAPDRACEVTVHHSTDGRGGAERQRGGAVTDFRAGSEAGAQRRARVLARLREVGVLSVADLARELKVSHMTVRRDLQRLETTGQVRTVHGGVGLAVGDPHLGVSGMSRDRAGPRRVARCAAELVSPGGSVALDAGPAAYELARALLDDYTGPVITHSMPVMQLLAERAVGSSGPRLVVLGGELTGNRQALVGPTTLDAIAGLRARTFFLDAAAVDVRGTYACSTAEARVDRALADIADEVVLLAPASAFTQSAPALVTRLDRLTAVVTDGPPPVSVVSVLDGAGVALHIADASASRTEQVAD